MTVMYLFTKHAALPSNNSLKKNGQGSKENKYCFLSSMNEPDGMCKKKKKKIIKQRAFDFWHIATWPEKWALSPTWPVIGTGFSTK